MKEWEYLIIAAVALVCSFALSAFLALHGHPVAVWLWRDILGMMQ